MNPSQTRPLHPIAGRACELLDTSLGIAELWPRLASLSESADLLWAIESLVVLSDRLALRGEDQAAAGVMQLAAAAAPALHLQADEVIREGVRRAHRDAVVPFGAPAQKLDPGAPERGEPAWKLDAISAMARRA